MSVLTWNNYKVSSFRWKKSHRAVVFASTFGSQALEASPPVWEVEMAGVPTYWAEARVIQTFFESFNGYQNQIELWDLTQPVPRGSMRGNLVLASSAAQGAVTLSVSGGAGQASATLLAGDMLGLGSGLTQQVVRVTQDSVADGSGVITVTIGTPLRNAFASGAVVTWNKPKALFRQKSLNEGIEFVPVVGQPWSLSLVEDWRP